MTTKQYNPTQYPSVQGGQGQKLYITNQFNNISQSINALNAEVNGVSSAISSATGAATEPLVEQIADLQTDVTALQAQPVYARPIILTGNTTFYMNNTSGVDVTAYTPGAGLTTGAAFKTWQALHTYVCRYVDAMAYSVTLQATGSIGSQPSLGIAQIPLQCSTYTINLGGLIWTCASTSSGCIQAIYDVTVSVTNGAFYAPSSGAYTSQMLVAQRGAKLLVTGGITWYSSVAASNGSSTALPLYAADGGQIYLSGSNTWNGYWWGLCLAQPHSVIEIGGTLNWNFGSYCVLYSAMASAVNVSANWVVISGGGGSVSGASNVVGINGVIVRNGIVTPGGNATSIGTGGQVS